MTMNSINAQDLDGLRAAVTGGTSGLGLALVEGLHRGGAEVAFVARNEERLQEVGRRVPGAHGIDGDVSRKEETHAPPCTPSPTPKPIRRPSRSLATRPPSSSS